MLEVNYVSRAKILNWVDGDTVDMDVDLLFRVHGEFRFRLLGLDTPERGKPGYKEATDFNKTHAPVGTEVLIKSVKSKEDKYGRFLVDIQLPDGTILNALLLTEKLAVPYDGGTKIIK